MFKRLLAITLAVILAVLSLPVISVEANNPTPRMRRPISGLDVTPARLPAGYTFNITFERPARGDEDTATTSSWQPDPPPAPWAPPPPRPLNFQEYPTQYDFGIRNATRGELWAVDPPGGWGNVRDSVQLPAVRLLRDLNAFPNMPGINTIGITTPISLEPGMLHEIWVDPYWENYRRFQYPVLGMPGFFTYVARPVPAPIHDRVPTLPMTTIFLSNVEITEVEATPSELFIQWQNPTWSNGRGGPVVDFFDEWVIAWSPVGAGGTASAIELPNAIPPSLTGPNSGHRVISVDDLDTQTIGGRVLFEHTITGLNIEPGVLLNLRVEPRRNGRWVRPSGGTPSLGHEWGRLEPTTVGGQAYRFSAVGNRNNDLPNEFRWRQDGVIRPIIVQPQLWGTPFGPDRILMEWDSLRALAQFVLANPALDMEVVLYEVTNAFDVFPRTPLFRWTDPAQIMNLTRQTVEWGARRYDRYFLLVIYITGQDPLMSNIEPVPYHGVEFRPWRPEIRYVQGLPVTPTEGMITNFRFLAFSRLPMNQDEQNWLATLVDQHGAPIDNYRFFVDPNIQYHVFVTDNAAHAEALRVAFNNPANPLNEASRSIWGHQLLGMTFPPQGLTWHEVHGGIEPNFNWAAEIRHFFPNNSFDPDAQVLLQGNRMYYVILFATWDGESSLGSIVQVFMPPFEEPEIEPVMLTAPPLRLIEIDIHEPQVTVGWDVRFLEIAENDFVWPEGAPPQVRWHGAAIVAEDEYGNRDLWYGSEAIRRGHPDGRDSILNRIISPADRMEIMIWNRELDTFLPDMNALLNRVRGTVAAHTELPANEIDLRITFLDGFYYQAHLAPLSAILNFPMDTTRPVESVLLDGPYGRFMRYMRSIPAAQWSAPFAPDQPAIPDGTRTFTFSALPFAGTLQPNTEYVLFIRTVHPTNPALVSYLPTYLMFTTPDDADRPAITPTVPVLMEYSDFVSSTSIGVYWRIQGNAERISGILEPTDMTYTIRWSEIIFDHPDSFQAQIPWLGPGGILEALRDVNNPSSVFNPLDPTNPVPESVPGPLYIRLLIPNMFPQTLYHVWLRATNTATPPAESGWSNPVSIWTRPLEPPPPPGLNRVPPAILNLVNVTPQPTDLFVLLTRIPADFGPRDDSFSGDGSIVPLPPVTHRSMFLALFEDLPPNTIFYVRARTIMSVSRAPIGATVSFSYEIQVSRTDTFIDVLTLFVPPLGAYDLRIMSSWVQIRVPTGADPGAFPGLEDPAQFPMPDRDFEITYDPLTQTLKFRFRTNRIGADGLPDQNADYRFIGRLNTERVTLYTVDLTSYAGLPITNRIIEVPVSIMNAFEERSVILFIATGHLDFSVPPGAFNTAQVRNLSMATRDYFQITVNYNPRHMPTIDVNTSFATIPAQLGVVASSNGRRTNINAFNRPLGVSLPTNGAQNIGLYRSGEGFVGWQDTRGEFSWANMSLNTSTYTPMTFAGIARNAPPIVGPGAAAHSPEVNQAMQRVLGRLNFTDLITFDRSRVVTVNEFNNVVNALANGRTNVTLGAQLTQAEVTALTRARFYTSASGFNRANATETLVRLYELRTRQVLTPITPVTSVPGLANAPANLHHNLRKAADIGFITGPFIPNEQLTMGELMIMLDIIIMDSGF